MSYIKYFNLLRFLLNCSLRRSFFINMGKVLFYKWWGDHISNQEIKSFTFMKKFIHTWLKYAKKSQHF